MSPAQTDSLRRKVTQKAREIRKEIKEHKKHVSRSIILGAVILGAVVVVAGKFLG